MYLKTPPSLKTPPWNFRVWTPAFQWSYLRPLLVLNDYNLKILSFSRTAWKCKFALPKQIFLPNFHIEKLHYLLVKALNTSSGLVDDRIWKNFYFAQNFHILENMANWFLMFYYQVHTIFINSRIFHEPFEPTQRSELPLIRTPSLLLEFLLLFIATNISTKTTAPHPANKGTGK